MKEVKIKAGATTKKVKKDGQDAEVSTVVTIELPETTVKLWQSPKELPIDRFADFQKYLGQAAGIGSTLGSVYGHIHTTGQLIAGDKKEQAIQELQNMAYNISIMVNRLNIHHIAFACLVNEFDNRKIIDYSEEAMNKLCKEMGAAGLTHDMVMETLSVVKKNSIQI